MSDLGAVLEKIDNLAGDIGDIKGAVFGNGKPGIKTDTDRLNIWREGHEQDEAELKQAVAAVKKSVDENKEAASKWRLRMVLAYVGLILLNIVGDAAAFDNWKLIKMIWAALI